MMRATLPLFLSAILPIFATATLLRDATEASFATLLNDNQFVLTCFSSRSFEPIFPLNKIFEEVAEGVKTPFVIINCDEEIELCKEQDINTYPALRLFKKKDGEDEEKKEKSEMIRYRGRHSKNAIRSFITKYELPVITHITSENLQAFKAINDIVVIAYLHSDQQDLLSTFDVAASHHHLDFVFGYSTDTATADAEGIIVPSIIAYRNMDGDHKVFNGHFSDADLEGFLDTATEAVIGEFSEYHMDAYLAKDKLAAYVFAYLDDDQTTTLRHELTPLAKKFEKYVTFGIVDAIEYGPMAKAHELPDDIFPALAVHAPVNDNVFTYQQGRKILAKEVESMLTTILQGKAASSQVFGGGAPDLGVEEVEVEAQERRERDEL